MTLYVTERGGSGPRLVFLHGLFGQGKNWTSIAKAFEQDHRVTLLDLPDHGRSDWTSRVSYLDMAALVADLLTTSYPAERVAVVGHSMGGKVAMVLALTRPELVERLCVVDIAPVAYARESSFGTFVAGMRALDLATLPDRSTADRALEPYAADPTVRSFLLQNLRRDGSGWRWQMNLDLLGDHLDTLNGWPAPVTPPYPGPTLWLAGSESDYIGRDDAPAMRALFPRVRLATVKGAGHWVHSERPAVFVAALRRFLTAGTPTGTTDAIPAP